MFGLNVQDRFTRVLISWELESADLRESRDKGRVDYIALGPDSTQVILVRQWPGRVDNTISTDNAKRATVRSVLNISLMHDTPLCAHASHLLKSSRESLLLY